jgi:hypothetical protein
MFGDEAENWLVWLCLRGKHLDLRGECSTWKSTKYDKVV